MTGQELEKKQKKIDHWLEKHHYVEAKKGLQQLKMFKPVPLKNIVLSAKYLLMVDDCEAFLNCLDNKWWLNFTYDGIDETLELYEQLWKEKWPDERELLRTQYMRKLVKFIGTETEEAKELQQTINQLKTLSEEFCTAGADSILMDIESITYTIMDVVWNYMIRLYVRLEKKSEYSIPEADWIENITNMGYLKERMEEHGNPFLIVSEKANESMCRAIGVMLTKMGKTVYLLEPPKSMAKTQDMALLVQKSLNSRDSTFYGMNCFQTYSWEDESGQQMDNQALLVQELSQNTPEKLVTVLGSGSRLDDLSMQDCLKQSFTRFNSYLGDIFEDNFSVGWAGNYISYISKIYNYDVSTSLKKEKYTCRYSIVIPARNSAESLRYTIQTCLDLDYPKSEYEIVISDNSTNNNMEVYNLCQELQDSRIQYYRTPRDLHLPKSFEYAFLQTRGEFILPIGSDDGILPWALTVLDQIRREYPQEEIIQWERGFYAWPGFNGGQQNQFVIPRGYQQGHYNIGYKKGSEYMREVLQDPTKIYGLPLLYINSGFKRSYMETLVERTGRLWDGTCQDIYMGVVNIILNEQILNLQYPLTIAGMTNSSVGATYSRANADDVQSMAFNDEERKTGNVGGFSISVIERLMPQLRSDVSSLYNSLLRSVARGILPGEYMWEHFEWKKMFEECTKRLDIQDVEYDKQIHYARYTASWHGQAFLQWFDEHIYSRAMEPRYIDTREIEKMKNEKMYVEGETNAGGLVMDASRYGVMDIYGAVQLFRRLSGLA